MTTDHQIGRLDAIEGRTIGTKTGARWPWLLPPMLAVCMIATFYVGNSGTDDIGYARLAYSILDPSQASDKISHHAARLGMTIPLALVFGLLGVSDATLSLLPAVLTVATAGLLARLVQRYFGDLAGFATGCVYALFPLTTTLAVVYLPEALVTFELTLAAWLLLAAISGGKKPIAAYFGAGLLIGLAYETSEAGILMLGVFGLYAALTRRLQMAQLTVVAGFVLVLALEMLWNAWLHGNPLFRFAMSSDYINDPMLLGQNQDLAYRLLKQYPAYFIHLNTRFGAYGPLLILGGLYGLLNARRLLFFVLWAAAFLIFYNFMSVSLVRYIALPADARLIHPACVALIAMTGVAISDLLHQIGRMGTQWLRLASYATVACLLAVVGTFSLVALDLDRHTPGKTTMIARNVEAIAQELRHLPRIDMASDVRSIMLIKFYRQFNGSDRYTELKSDGLAPVPTLVDGGFVLLNMPVLFERELTGAEYDARERVKLDGGSIREDAACVSLAIVNPDYGRPALDVVLGDGWSGRRLGVQRPFNRSAEYTRAELYRCKFPH